MWVTRRGGSSRRPSDAVRMQWSCFDEIEKAHPEVFHILLQILDDGRLTDAQGRTVDFRNAVIIMTSNIGSQYILQEAGSTDWEVVEGHVRNEMHQHFRPEFLNRIDDVILFRPLSREDLRRIVDLQLEVVAALAQDLGVRIEVEDGVKDSLAAEGYDPVYGARPLKRVIQQRIQNPLALQLLRDPVEEGSLIRVLLPAVEGEDTMFEVLESKPAVAGLTGIPVG